MSFPRPESFLQALIPSLNLIVLLFWDICAGHLTARNSLKYACCLPEDLLHIRVLFLHIISHLCGTQKIKMLFTRVEIIKISQTAVHDIPVARLAFISLLVPTIYYTSFHFHTLMCIYDAYSVRLVQPWSRSIISKRQIYVQPSICKHTSKPYNYPLIRFYGT